MLYVEINGEEPTLNELKCLYVNLATVCLNVSHYTLSCVGLYYQTFQSLNFSYGKV